jgi:hypothetical protein
MNYNKNAGYGQVIGQFPFIGSGKVFIVGDSGTANRDMLVDIFDTDIDGKARFFATLDAAIGECTSNAGDVIYVMPGHTETVTATSIALDVAGVTIIGLGNGLDRPTFTFGAATATITVSAANCAVKNCHFIGNFDNVAAAFTVGAAKDFVLEGNTFVDVAADKHFVSILVTGSTNNAADGLVVRGNYWTGLAVAPNAFVSILANEDRVVLEDNDVFMAATNDAGHFVTLAAKVITNARIRKNNLIVTGATDATVGIFLTGSATTCTGIVSENKVASLDTTTELIATAGTKLSYFENYYTGTADASGKLWPTADGA